MKMTQHEILQHDLTEEWNAKVKIGDTVEYHSYPGAEPQLFTTRTDASVLSDHTCVVWLNGKSGCVAVDACKRLGAGLVDVGG